MILMWILSIIYAILALICVYAIIKNKANMFLLVIPGLFCMLVIWANITNKVGLFGLSGIIGIALIVFNKIKTNSC